MRCTQLIGLSAAASKFLSDNVKMVPVSWCPHCKKELTWDYLKKEAGSAKSYGMFDDGPELEAYELKDGTWVHEIVQAVPWSSGPCIFLCLENDKGERIGEWSDKEIEQA